MISSEEFQRLVDLIADGELDEYMIDLLKHIDDRNSRRKQDVMRLVKSVYGEDAVVEKSGVQQQQREPQPYAPADDVRPDQLSGAMRFPDPIISSGGGVGGSLGAAEFSPAKDPMGPGGGDDESSIVSTGAQIG